MKIKTTTFLILLALMSFSSYGQVLNDLKMTSDYGPEGKELIDLYRFENIDYYKIKFIGNDLKNKSYIITAKEIWNGKIKTEKIVFDSKEMEGAGFDKVNDTLLKIKVLSKYLPNNKLKISFMFDRFSTTKEFNATKTDEYSLRNLADESKLNIGYDKKFYFMAYILPHQNADGSKSWCEVGVSGKDIDNWGKKFGIKHYIIFEMKFE